MITWINLSRAVRREITKTAKRGPTPFEIAQQKIWNSEARQERMRQAAVASEPTASED